LVSWASLWVKHGEWGRRKVFVGAVLRQGTKRGWRQGRWREGAHPRLLSLLLLLLLPGLLFSL